MDGCSAREETEKAVSWIEKGLDGNAHRESSKEIASLGHCFEMNV